MEQLCAWALDSDCRVRLGSVTFVAVQSWVTFPFSALPSPPLWNADFAADDHLQYEFPSFSSSTRTGEFWQGTWSPDGNYISHSAMLLDVSSGVCSDQ